MDSDTSEATIENEDLTENFNIGGINNVTNIKVENNYINDENDVIDVKNGVHEHPPFSPTKTLSSIVKQFQQILNTDDYLNLTAQKLTSGIVNEILRQLNTDENNPYIRDISLTFTRVFTNIETSEAYKYMFQEVITTVEYDTNKIFKFNHIDGKGLKKTSKKPRRQITTKAFNQINNSRSNNQGETSGNANMIIELDKDENNNNVTEVSQSTLDNALFVQEREIALLEKKNST
ncbi:3243_t:CDS:2 [Funneliformis mosseae]|uniref:3243_t:CDS:1 n=1 Tax=Funneliformis mosseae TaxID=27381 RepID=A0A9N9DQN1_FUNMO|nr:3243_t:CDS:2 [Funneliformis mosseae]